MPTKRRSRKKKQTRRFAWWPAHVPWRRIALAAGFVLAGLALLSLLLPGEGAVTHGLAVLLRRLLGWSAYLLPAALAAGLFFLGVRRRQPDVTRITGGTLVLLAALAATHLAQRLPNPFVLAVAGYGGGWFGFALAQVLHSAFGTVGAYCILLGLGLVGLLLTFELPPARLWTLAARAHLPAKPVEVPAGRRARQLPLPERHEAPARRRRTTAIVTAPAAAEREAQPPPRQTAPRLSRPQAATTAARPQATAAEATEDRDFAEAAGTPASGWELPDAAAIFSQVEEESTGDDLVEERAEIIEDTLAALGVPAEVVEALKGPAVTQFAVRPGTIERRAADGTVKHLRIRVSKIASLADDLALALSASPVRIQAPIPGRSVVGIEVPNPQTQIVPLGAVFFSEDFQRLTASPLALALGRDISGRPVVADLGKMPHLLMAGSTGSGKSIAINAIIATLLARNTPRSLRLVLVDPKRVELANYNGLPHLIGKVVSDAEEAVAALKWATREMDRRYAAFADVGARDIRGYNSRMEREGNAPLPRIVAVIDELADLMMSAPYDVERTLCRLAQMARATGIHLVVATQRPSVDVLTGLVKANFPARIAFAVSSMVDSRVVLDTPGAERLLGRGDMLYMSPSGTRLTRCQGCWVTDEEIAALVRYWRQTGATAPLDGPLVQGALWPEAGEQGHDAEEDPLLAEAIEIVKKEGRASTTMLQRHLRVGYNRASRLVDTLVERGIVSAQADARHGSRSVVAADPEAEAGAGNGHEPEADADEAGEP
ncbi:MAG: DNA translocase FtsK [Anaerolineae bacterium]